MSEVTDEYPVQPGGVAGSVSVKVVPSPSVLVIVSFPPCASTTALVIDSPRPTPGMARRVAVDNLVSNAIKFTPSGGTVRVGVTPNASAGADVVVADTGIGIPPDELSQLTTRFFRASTATRRAIPGVGLGLSITKAVVDAHGGSLAITSALGEGTTFTITLPPTPPG